MLATGEAIRSTGEAISPRVNMLDEALNSSVHSFILFIFLLQLSPSTTVQEDMPIQ